MPTPHARGAERVRACDPRVQPSRAPGAQSDEPGAGSAPRPGQSPAPDTPALRPSADRRAGAGSTEAEAGTGRPGLQSGGPAERRRAKVPSLPGRSGRGPRALAAAMMGQPGGVGGVRQVPRAGVTQTPCRPGVGRGHNCPRYSRFVHQLPHLPHVQHLAPRGPGRCSPQQLPTNPGALPRRGRSSPGSPQPLATSDSPNRLLLPRPRRRR